MSKYFTYINGLRGLEPQIWYDSPVDGAGKSKPSAVPPIELPDSDRRTLEELMRDYPIEAAK